jgi:large subunit ribosomal protein L17
MLRALTANLVAHERIETTDAKAKELKRVAERVITRAIRLGDLAYTANDKLSLTDRARRQAAQRQVGRFLRRFAVVQQGSDTRKIDLVEKVFLDLAKRFKSRPGGYTRIIKAGRRRGDNAPMSIIEFVEATAAPEAESGAKKTRKKAAPAAEAATEGAASSGKSGVKEDAPAKGKGKGKTAKAEAAGGESEGKS